MRRSPPPSIVDFLLLLLHLRSQLLDRLPQQLQSPEPPATGVGRAAIDLRAITAQRAEAARRGPHLNRRPCDRLLGMLGLLLIQIALRKQGVRENLATPFRGKGNYQTFVLQRGQQLAQGVE